MPLIVRGMSREWDSRIDNAITAMSQGGGRAVG
jgi:hypothetical protein